MTPTQQRVVWGGRGGTGKSVGMINQAYIINRVATQLGANLRAGIFSWDKSHDFATYFKSYRGITHADEAASIEDLFTTVTIPGKVPTKIPLLSRLEHMDKFPLREIQYELRQKMPLIFVDTAGDPDALDQYLEADSGVTHYVLVPDSVNREIISDKDRKFIERFREHELKRYYSAVLTEIRQHTASMEVIQRLSTSKCSKEKTFFQALVLDTLEDYLRINVDGVTSLSEVLSDMNTSMPLEQAIAKAFTEAVNNHAEGYIRLTIRALKQSASRVLGDKSEPYLRAALADLGFSGRFMRSVDLHTGSDAKYVQMDNFIPAMTERGFGLLYVLKFAQDYLRKAGEQDVEAAQKVLSLLYKQHGERCNDHLEEALQSMPKPQGIEAKVDIVSFGQEQTIGESEDIIDAEFEEIQSEENNTWDASKLACVLSELFGSDISEGYLHESYMQVKSKIMPHLYTQEGVALQYEDRPANRKRIQEFERVKKESPGLTDMLSQVRRELSIPFGMLGNKIEAYGLFTSTEQSWSRTYDMLTNYAMQRFGIGAFVNLGYIPLDREIERTLDRKGMEYTLTNATLTDYMKRFINSDQARDFYHWDVKGLRAPQSWIPSLRLSRFSQAGLDAILAH